MDLETEIIKEDLQFEEQESTFCVKAERVDEDISTYGVYQNNKIVGNTIKEVSDNEEMWETNIHTKEEEVVLEVKEIKTEELMLKSESEDDDSERGSATDLEESNDDEDEMWEKNINTKEEKAALEMKEESNSDEMYEGSLSKIKTEELMLKSESDDDSSKTG